MAGANILELTDQNFDSEVIQSKVPVLVDFWAEWCGPCKMLAPTVEAVANEFGGQVKVGKLNVDDHVSSASRFNIRGIPTLLLFKDGQIKEQLVGVQPKSAIEKALNRHLNNA